MTSRPRPWRPFHDAAGVAAPALAALIALAGCNLTRSTAPSRDNTRELPSAATEPDIPVPMPIPPPVEVQPPAAATVVTPPPCVCAELAPKPHPKPKPRQKEPVKEPEPQSVGPVPPPSNAVVNAEVGRIEAPLTSILGKNVYSPKGEDLGRVVDLLADPEGRVRVAIIDFGGFLGVGIRRIAVDWPLLHFNPGDKDKPLVLTVTREKLQSTPEYKDAASPRVLMPPAALDDAGAGAKK